MSVAFLDEEGAFQGRSQVLQNFEAWLLIKGEGRGVGSGRVRTFLLVVGAR